MIFTLTRRWQTAKGNPFSNSNSLSVSCKLHGRPHGILTLTAAFTVSMTVCLRIAFNILEAFRVAWKMANRGGRNRAIYLSINSFDIAVSPVYERPKVEWGWTWESTCSTSWRLEKHIGFCAQWRSMILKLYSPASIFCILTTRRRVGKDVL